MLSRCAAPANLKASPLQGLSPDVAGATFMAAGSSSPELFVAGLAVFVTHDPVGVGAATGSTMFNFCTIIGGAAAAVAVGAVQRGLGRGPGALLGGAGGES